MATTDDRSNPSPRRTLRDGFSIAAVILGAAAVVFSVTGFGGVVFGALGLVFGVMGIRTSRANRQNVLGLITAGIGFLGGAVVVGLFVAGTATPVVNVCSQQEGYRNFLIMHCYRANRG